MPRCVRVGLRPYLGAWLRNPPVSLPLKLADDFPVAADCERHLQHGDVPPVRLTRAFSTERLPSGRWNAKLGASVASDILRRDRSASFAAVPSAAPRGT
jgi:hypothetical protein